MTQLPSGINMQKAMQFIRSMAQEKGKNPDKYASAALQALFQNNKFNEVILEEMDGDPVKAFAFVALHNLRVEKLVKVP